MIKKETNLSVSNLKNTNIENINTNVEGKVFTNEYLFAYKDNDFIVDIKGGAKRWYTEATSKLLTTKRALSMLEYSHFKDITNNEKNVPLLIKLRKSILFDDPTIYNDLYVMWGNTLADLSEKGMKYFDIKSIHEYILFLKSNNYSIFQHQKLLAEKTALFYSESKKVFELRFDLDSAVDIKSIETLTGTIKQKNKNGSMRYISKGVYIKGMSDLYVLDEIPLKLLSKVNVVPEDVLTIEKVPYEIKNSIMFVEKDSNVYVNKTSSFIYAKFDDKVEIINPFGILVKKNKLLYTQLIEDVYCNIDFIKSDSYTNAIAEKGANIDGLYLTNANAVMENGFVVSGGKIKERKEIDGVLSLSNNPQIGSFETIAPDGSILCNKKEHPLYKIEVDVKKEGDILCKVLKGSCDKNGVSYKEETERNFNVKIESNKVLVKKQDEAHYYEPDTNEKGVLCIKDGTEILRKVIERSFNNMELISSLQYETFYHKKSNSNNLVRVINRVKDIYYYKFPSNVGFGGPVCHGGYDSPLGSFSTMEVSDAISNDKFSLNYFCDVEAKEKELVKSVKYFFGLKREIPFFFLGMSLNTSNLHNGIKGFPYNNMYSNTENSRKSNINRYSLNIKISDSREDIPENILICETSKHSQIINPNNPSRNSYFTAGCYKATKTTFSIGPSDPKENPTIIDLYTNGSEDSLFYKEPKHLSCNVEDVLAYAGNNDNYNLGTIKGTKTGVKDIELAILSTPHPSTIDEYLWNWQGDSYILSASYLKIDEAGLFFVNNGIMELENSYTTELIVEQNKRGLVFKSGNTTIKVVTVYDKTAVKKVTIQISLYVEDELVGKDSVTYDNVFVDLESFAPAGGEYKYLDRNTKINVGDGDVSISGTIQPEVFLNYLYKQGVRQNVVVVYDEEENGMLNDSDVKYSFNKEEKGYSFNATYKNNNLEFLNIPAAINAYKNGVPFNNYGKFFVRATKTFLFKYINRDSYSDNSGLLMDILKMGTISTSIKTNTLISSNIGLFTPYVFNIDSRIIANKEELKMTIPNNQKVQAFIETGLRNKFTTSEPMIFKDNIYDQGLGVLIQNKSTLGEDVIEYWKLDKNVVFKRLIKIDSTKQTSFSSTFDRNIATQLIQDLREDTVAKRTEDPAVYIEFDLDFIADKIHTWTDKIYDIPLSFKCNSEDKYETRANSMIEYLPVETKEIDGLDLLNMNGSRFVWISNNTDDIKSVSLKIKNHYFRSAFGIEYDYSLMYQYYNNKQILLKDFIENECVYDENNKKRITDD